MRTKAPKLVARDFAVQASIANVLESHRLITDMAREADIALPLLATCHALYKEASSLGPGEADVVAVLRAIEERSSRRQS